MTAVEIERNAALAVGVVCSVSFLALLAGTFFVHTYYCLPAAVFFYGACKGLSHADELSDYLEED